MDTNAYLGAPNTSVPSNTGVTNVATSLTNPQIGMNPMSLAGMAMIAYSIMAMKRGRLRNLRLPAMFAGVYLSGMGTWVGQKVNSVPQIAQIAAGTLGNPLLASAYTTFAINALTGQRARRYGKRAYSKARTYTRNYRSWSRQRYSPRTAWRNRNVRSRY